MHSGHILVFQCKCMFSAKNDTVQGPEGFFLVGKAGFIFWMRGSISTNNQETHHFLWKLITSSVFEMGDIQTHPNVLPMKLQRPIQENVVLHCFTKLTIASIRLYHGRDVGHKL